jgi:hypothetical protein
MSAHTVMTHAQDQGRGVSLGKATDRAYPNGVVMVPSEVELDRRRYSPAEERFTRRSDGLEINCPDALRAFFAEAAGTVVVWTGGFDLI